MCRVAIWLPQPTQQQPDICSWSVGLLTTSCSWLPKQMVPLMHCLFRTAEETNAEQGTGLLSHPKKTMIVF